jgi:3-hydroxy-9,10-secoandrosta-1,3,5(10)-triene-9,17-dione monooxygenase
MVSTPMSGCSLDRPGTSDEARALRAELVGRAREIVPVLARNAARTEEQRRVVEENISLIDEAGLYSIMKPKRLGGLETDIRTKLEVSRELARGCGSTAWVSTLMNVCSFFAGLFPDQAQRDVWEVSGERSDGGSGSPGNRIAGVLAPSAEATRIDGGYRVTGSWGWASGCLHAQWAVVGFPVPDDRGEIVDQGLALVPMTDLTIEDTWYVAGMRGTGSNTLVAKDIVIPEHRVISIPAAIGGRYATEHTDEALYRSAFVPVAAVVLAGPQLGLAQAALDLVIEKAPKRSVSYTFYDTQTEAPTVQLAVAKAASLVDAAHLFAYRAAADIDQAAADGTYPDYAARARVRMDTGAAIENAREAIRVLISAHGAGSFAESSPLQRIWRDSEVASRHAVISPAISSEVYGRALLGLTDGVTALV